MSRNELETTVFKTCSNSARQMNRIAFVIPFVR